MPKHLKRLVGPGDFHFITFCCYQRRQLLGTVGARNLAVEILRQVRSRCHFALIGYVFMPDDVHLLISESPASPPAKVLQVFKQRLSRPMRGKKRVPVSQISLHFAEPQNVLRRFWQRGYYDFNVYSRAKIVEKLHYMHANPVRENLVQHPGDWPWSSWNFYHGRDALLAMDVWNAPSIETSIAIRRREEQLRGIRTST